MSLSASRTMGINFDVILTQKFTSKAQYPVDPYQGHRPKGGACGWARGPNSDRKLNPILGEGGKREREAGNHLQID